MNALILAAFAEFPQVECAPAQTPILPQPYSAFGAIYRKFLSIALIGYMAESVRPVRGMAEKHQSRCNPAIPTDEDYLSLHQVTNGEKLA